MKFADWKIKSKILAGSLSLVVITVVFGGLSYLYIGKMATALFGITDNNAKSVEYASGILNQIFVNFNLAKLITNYLMSASDSKIMVKVGQKEYININFFNVKSIKIRNRT